MYRVLHKTPQGETINSDTVDNYSIASVMAQMVANRGYRAVIMHNNQFVLSIDPGTTIEPSMPKRYRPRHWALP